MALRISIVVNEPGNSDTKHRFGVKLMEALQEFDSGASVTVDDDEDKMRATSFEHLKGSVQS